VHYDPLLAKVIASAETREAAIARLAAALRAYPILGIQTNIPFLIAVLEHPRFRAGDVDTAFVDRECSALVGQGSRALPDFIAEALPLLDEEAFDAGSRAAGRPRAADPWSLLRGWRA
jgi:3-methylcrotonyl-CoA carboxylase alpha subunit